MCRRRRCSERAESRLFRPQDLPRRESEYLSKLDQQIFDAEMRTQHKAKSFERTEDLTIRQLFRLSTRVKERMCTPCITRFPIPFSSRVVRQKFDKEPLPFLSNPSNQMLMAGVQQGRQSNRLCISADSLRQRSCLVPLLSSGHLS